ncbi:MAG: hypothetical protein H6932_17555 [Burkholderiaceae bacterium]|nr:hypothetical protein [Burkholderiaceae bacterium]
MKRWLVTLVWWLSLALPLQGLAVAAPMMSFGSMHDGPAALHDGSPAPCHESEAPAAADDATAHAGCSQCAVCHASAAPVPPAAAAPGAARQAEAPPAWRAPVLSAVDPDGLDRPPRRAFV